jgi:Domain of unknown function DUF302
VPADPRLSEFAARHARWADASEPSPHGFVLYWRADVTPAMTVAGERRPCTAYLMGSQALAERVYRQDPAVMLYVPLRTLVYIDTGDRTRFAVDQPSTVLAGFAGPAAAELGARLDRQLAGLLDALGVQAGPALDHRAPANHLKRVATYPPAATQA